MKLGLDLVVAVTLDNGGTEVRVRVGGDNNAKVHEAAEPDLVVGHNLADVLEGDAALGGGVALVSVETGFDVVSFVVAEPFLLVLLASFSHHLDIFNQNPLSRPPPPEQRKKKDHVPPPRQIQEK